MCVYLDNFDGFLKPCQQSIFKLNNQDKMMHNKCKNFEQSTNQEKPNYKTQHDLMHLPMIHIDIDGCICSSPSTDKFALHNLQP
jgi:hypothetical protein